MPPMLADLPAAFDPIRGQGVEVDFNQGPYPLAGRALADRIGDARIVIAGLDRVDDTVLAACPNLRHVARNGVGLDNVDIAAATRRSVIVTAPLGANSTSVAELAIGLMVGMLRGVVFHHRELQGGVWHRRQGRELAGKTLGIVGLGRIGRRVATRAQAFEMQVIANDIAPDRAFAEEHSIPFVSFEELIRRSDIVTMHVPLTADTHNMIDACALAAMKPGAYLINTARAGVVDPVALGAALHSGHLAGAAIDVHLAEGDKGGEAHPALVGRPNVITTPHLGGYTVEALARTTEVTVQSIVEALQGRKPFGLVNPEVWP